MTRKQAIALIPIGAVVAVGVVVGHLLLPLESASWTLNRLLHHVCEGVAAAGAVGAVAWTMWPRPKPRRRDTQREHARRRVFALVGAIVLAVVLVVFAELRRESASRARLSGAAVADLEAIGRALEAYAAAHGGEHPAEIAALVPDYLGRDGLYYACREGPAPVPPPAADAADAPAPSYALVKRLPRRDDKPHPDPVLAYLVPGQAWGPLTVVLEEGGRCRVVGDDRVAAYEARRTEAP
jgi:hypothetical protein